jgi:uncharacterized protein (DUF1697 family)
VPPSKQTMTAYVALLRGVNLGGNNTLAMADLKRLCEEAGLEAVKTYIASGNVLFKSALSEAKVKKAIEDRLHKHAGKRIDVFVRTAEEMKQVVSDNPFNGEPGNRVVAVFLDGKAPADTATNVSGGDREKAARGKREVYIHYPDGIGRSKFKVPAAANGTARNMNTVAKLAEMAASL